MGTLNGFGATIDPSAAVTSADRVRLIQRIRRQIADGSYESDCKLNEAILKLVKDLDLQPRLMNRLGPYEGRGK